MRTLSGQLRGNLDTIAKKFQGCGVRLPKGFRKNYFRLSAITATVNHVTLHAQRTSIEAFHMPRSLGSYDAELLEEELDSPPEEILLSQKPCRCNCYFLKKTRKILRLHPNPKYFFNYFKSLNNAISPPRHAMIFTHKKHLNY